MVPFLRSHRKPKAEENTKAQPWASPGPPTAPECANQCAVTSCGSALSQAVTAVSCTFGLCLLWGVCVQEAELLLWKLAAWDLQQHIFALTLLKGGSLQRPRVGEAFQCKYML